MKSLTPKSLLLFFFSLFFINSGFSQTCEVEKESIKGTYTGDCKKGKAHGKGKATGADIYDGDFKNGLPDGQGTYTSGNGNIFTGKYARGLRDGKGTLVIKREAQQDSVVDGYWKKDSYIGKHEYPYKVLSKTKAISAVEVEYTKDEFSRISIGVTNVSGGQIGTGGIGAKMRINDIQVMEGTYGRSIDNNTHYKKTEKILLDVIAPLRIKLVIASEEVEIVFNEKGSYTVEIKIMQ